MSKTIAIIPCRFKSSRLPGKPLKEICGIPMYMHVYKQSLRCNELDDVFIATDDDRIKESCKKNGVPVIMTDSSCVTGTDRVAEAANSLDCEIVVNIQGDEPMIDPVSIDMVAKEMKNSIDIFATNAFTIIDSDDADNPHIVKALISNNSNALMFSRSKIPYKKNMSPIYRQQLGLYAFKKESLLMFPKLCIGEIEQAEDIEMLRVIENGYTLKMVEVQERSISVDTLEDLLYVRSIMER